MKRLQRKLICIVFLAVSGVFFWQYFLSRSFRSAIITPHRRTA